MDCRRPCLTRTARGTRLSPGRRNPKTLLLGTKASIRNLNYTTGRLHAQISRWSGWLNLRGESVSLMQWRATVTHRMLHYLRPVGSQRSTLTKNCCQSGSGIARLSLLRNTEPRETPSPTNHFTSMSIIRAPRYFSLAQSSITRFLVVILKCPMSSPRALWTLPTLTSRLSCFLLRIRQSIRRWRIKVTLSNSGDSTTWSILEGVPTSPSQRSATVTVPASPTWEATTRPLSCQKGSSWQRMPLAILQGPNTLASMN